MDRQIHKDGMAVGEREKKIKRGDYTYQQQ